MEDIIKEEEIDGIVGTILADYKGEKNIDNTDIFSKPDKKEVRDIIHNLFRIVFPGYYKDKNYKIYNLKALKDSVLSGEKGDLNMESVKDTLSQIIDDELTVLFNKEIENNYKRYCDEYDKLNNNK